MKYDYWTVAPAEGRRVSGVPELVGRVLAARGIVGEEAARDFLRCDPGLFQDPFQLKDMDKAVARLRLALERGETIAIYGDYDVDGVTSTCLLFDFFRRRGAKALWYIPRRLEDGYGLNPGGLNALKARGAELVVTVDCGITAVDEVEYAKSLGMEVIITDHHACKDALPDAAAVIDPHRPDCPYPFKGLAGVGVALKLAMALGADWKDYVDLAALGTVADVMPLLEENRAIVHQGLAAINAAPRPGIRALLDAAGSEEKGTAVTRGYTLAPRLNAAGRLGVTEVSMELLLSPDAARAKPLAEELCELNRRRQGLEGDIFKQCVGRVETELAEDAAIVLAGEGWHQGVVGIVASRLAERFHRPAFMIAVDVIRGTRMGKGSCRSYGGVCLFNALESCADILEGYGGHAMAAGFTVKEENIPALRARLCAWVAEHREESGGSLLQVDVELPDTCRLTVEEVAGLDLLEPFGAGNPKPVFLLSRASVTAMDEVGMDGKHLRLRLQSRDDRLAAIFFSYPKTAWHYHPGDQIDVAFTPQVNEYHGKRSVQLVLQDVRNVADAIHERQLYLRYRQGETLAPREARALIPTRSEFEALWRYLRAEGPLWMESAPHLSYCLARAMEHQESLGRTMIALEVFAERGLLTLEEAARDRFNVTLRPRGAKVDLEESPILTALRAWAGEG